VHLKQQRIDPFRQGICLYVGKASTDLSPVAAILAYLVAQVD